VMPIRGIRGQALADELLAAYDALEEMFRDAFLQQIATLSRSRALKDLLDEIDAGDLSFGDPIDSRLESLVISQKRLDDIIEAAMETGARVTQKVVDVGGEFNVLNPAVRNTANNLSVQLSTTLNNVTRQTISDILRDAIEGNITTLQAARKIRSHIGLLPQHSKAVDKYLNKMLADGVAKRLANKRADEYAERLLKYRSETIARTEIARAMGEGQTEYWKQMASEGYLPPNAKRIWMTSRDELVCPICGPMDGVEADIDGYWTTINGEAVAYPQASHPNCRCSSGIVFPKGSVSKSTIEKANPYHDERGRFTSANAAVGGAGVRGGRRKKTKTKVKPKKKEFDIDQTFSFQRGFGLVVQRGNKKSTVALRDAIESYTFSGELDFIVREASAQMPHTSKKPLHRGMVLDEDGFSDFVSQLKIGKKIDAGGSWTESLTVAREFANADSSPTMQGMGEFSVLVTVKSGARGLHIAPYASSEWKYQREWMLPERKMKVASFRVSGKRVYVELEQQ